MTFNSDKQKYLIKQTGHLAGSLGQMERESWGTNRNENEWLKSKIKALGGTPSSNYIADLYKQLVSLASYPTSNFVNENRRTWYRQNS